MFSHFFSLRDGTRYYLCGDIFYSHAFCPGAKYVFLLGSSGNGLLQYGLEWFAAKCKAAWTIYLTIYGPGALLENCGLPLAGGHKVSHQGLMKTGVELKLFWSVAVKESLLGEGRNIHPSILLTTYPNFGVVGWLELIPTRTNY